MKIKLVLLSILLISEVLFAQSDNTENVLPTNQFPPEQSPSSQPVYPSEIQNTSPSALPGQEQRRPGGTPLNEERLLQAIKTNPTDRNAYTKLLEYYRALNRTQDHLKTLIKAIQNLGGNLTYYLWMGDDYMTLQDYSKALISYQYALKETPNNPIVYLKLGNAHLLQKNYYSAETALLAALYYGENSGKINVAFTYRLLGECYENVKNYSEALKWYQKAYRREPTEDHKTLVERLQTRITNQ